MDQLYRVRVLVNDDKSVDVSPAMLKEAAEQYCDTIKAQIKLGREKQWKDPIIYPIYR